MPSFLEELQAMSEARKRQVLVISAVIVMAIVVGVWLAYFNGIVMGGAGVRATDVSAPAGGQPSAPAAVPAPAGPSLWTRIKDGLGSLGRMFSAPSQYQIQPQQ